MAQKIFCVWAYNKTTSFKIVQERYGRNGKLNTFPNWNQIFKLVQNFEAYSTCEDHRATYSTPHITEKIQTITHEECASIIKNFAYCFQQILQTKRWTFETSTLGLILKFLVHVWNKMVANPIMLSFYLSINLILFPLSQSEFYFLFLNPNTQECYQGSIDKWPDLDFVICLPTKYVRIYIAPRPRG